MKVREAGFSQVLGNQLPHFEPTEETPTGNKNPQIQEEIAFDIEALNSRQRKRSSIGFENFYQRPSNGGEEEETKEGGFLQTALLDQAKESKSAAYAKLHVNSQKLIKI